MGKKKLSLKPVQRGFATTSVPTKKAKDDAAAAAKAKAEAEEAAKQEELEQKAVNEQSAAPDTSTSQQGDATETWDNDEAVDIAAYQGLVDRLQEKAEKDYQRVVKAIDFDKRFASSFPRLAIDDKVKDQSLKWAIEDSTLARPETTNTTSDGDKKLVNLFVTYKVLQHLGFSEDRVEQCILEGIRGDGGWVEGEEWLWLHLSEDECRQGLKEKEQQISALQDASDAPLVDVAPSAIPSDANTPKSSAIATPTNVDSTTAAPGSMFQTLDGASSDSETDSDADPDMNKVNETWANLMVELDTMKMAAGMAKAKGKKGKGPQVVLETPEMVKVKNKITKVEKDYMFSRKDADSLFKALKSKRDMQALEAKLRSASVSNATSGVSSPVPEAATPPVEAASTSIFDSTPDGEDEDEDSGGLFGAMLDEPSPAAESQPTESSTTAIRSMPVPKQHAFTGNTPKALLRATLGKASKQAVISYVRLSPNNRVARSGLEIRWSAEKRRVWRMEEFACESVEEADNYVATLALNDLLAAGDITGVNWRSMPPAHRELWGELDDSRALRENERKREFWKKIKELADRKADASKTVSEAGAAKASQTAAPAPQASPRPPPLSYSKDLQDGFQKRSSSAAYLSMREGRDTLPIAPFREQIIKVLDTTQILVFSGETGCGKSTQLPSFILEDQLSKGKPCKIVVTEPRRISAISLAQRVSAELGEAPGALGGGSSLVGYSIRLESKMSINTRLAFVTNGIALRMLEGGSEGSKGTAFDEVTHIVVDEVHERSIESDFLLIILKELLKVRTDLKIILMSATVDAEKLSEYFGGCPAMSVPGRTFPVQVNYLEDAVEMAGWHIDDSSPYAVWARNKKTGVKQLEWTEDNSREDGDLSDGEEKLDDPTKLSATRYSARTVSTVNTLDSRKIPYDLIVRLLERICFEDADLSSFSAATLVFMPGLAEIRKLNDELQTHPRFGTRDFVIYPLHSTISSEGQSAVFQVPPRGVRKIVISTNIAETGVTIPDITCVIDSGKQREMRYDEKRQLSRLVETYIARSNAKQRRGRAGRVQEGLAFHLFTKARHDTQLAEHPIPEMLRLSLQDLALRIKILKVKLGNSVEEVLLRALDPPSSTNIQRAVAALVEVKALTANEEITPMGRLLSKLPMDVHLGKFLLVAALFRCLDPALTIAATLNGKSPFITPFGFEAQAEAAKKGFATDNSDFLTLVNVFDSWRRASDNPTFVRTFCKRNYVSHQNLQQIEELRQQLLAYLVDSSFINASPELKQSISKARYSRGFRTRFVTVPPELSTNGQNPRVLGAALAAGLYPKLLAIDASGGLRTVTNQQPVAIHPSSVNHRVSKSEFGTGHLVYFTLMQSKRLYAWETGPVEDQALALLCGDAAEIKLSASSLQIDRKLRYQVDPKSALAIKLLREQFAAAMAARLRGRTLTPRQEQWFTLGLQCIAAEGGSEDQGVIVI